MNGPLSTFFINDHRRLDDLLDRAAADPHNIDQALFLQFRAGILKHIAMEEKLFFPAARRKNDDFNASLADRLRLDHGAITALMVLPPSPVTIAALRAILAIHDELEERYGGMYEICERLTRDEEAGLLAALQAFPEVPMHPYNPGTMALEAARRALARAGYDLDDPGKSQPLPNSP